MGEVIPILNLHGPFAAGDVNDDSLLMKIWLKLTRLPYDFYLSSALLPLKFF